MGLRLDRLATLYLTAPFLRVVPRRERSVPILMYHSITDEDESNTHAYYRTKTSPAVFRAQLKWLHDSGYTTCSLAQALQQLQTQTEAADKLVVITFDDGYRDIYQQAFPLLNQYGFSATVFLPTAYIGQHPVSFKGRECLTWAEVRELNHRGILFGSHTVNHPQLRELSVSAVREEIANSKKTIEEQLGCAVDSFAYPYAFPQTDSDFTRMLRDSLRLPVNSCDDRALFNAKLAGAYDWISKFQFVTKTVKSRLRNSVSGAKRGVSKDFPAVQ